MTVVRNGSNLDTGEVIDSRFGQITDSDLCLVPDLAQSGLWQRFVANGLNIWHLERKQDTQQTECPRKGKQLAFDGFVCMGNLYVL